MKSNRKTMTGLTLRGEIYHINKQVNGKKIYESTGTSSRAEAEEILARRILDVRKAIAPGRVRIFREAATRFLTEFADQPSIKLSATYLSQADPFIGHLALDHIDDEALKPFVDWMLSEGKHPDGKRKRASSYRTVNIALERIIHVLHLCQRTWAEKSPDGRRLPWLLVVPRITKLNEQKTARISYPLTWEEQRLLFSELPVHLQPMALFKVNTGCREQEVCKLRWDWEVTVPELETSVFIIPPDFGGRDENSGVKNGEERVVVLNRTAKSIIEGQRKLLDNDEHKGREWVFPFNGKPIHRMNSTAWKSARVRAAEKWIESFNCPPHPDFKKVRIHDLKHTFGRRLRAAGVDFETRQVLLGHKTKSVTTHYSGAELAALIDAANKVAATSGKSPTLTLLRRRKAA